VATNNFFANGIVRQAYEFRKQLQGLEIDTALLSETYLKPHMWFYIPNYDFMGLTVKAGKKEELPFQLRNAYLTLAST
jgi:hypothetical protein